MTQSSSPPIGFVGLGRMGGPMAANLVSAGHRLVVYDAAGTPERAPEGATVADAVATLATTCPVILLSLPDGSAVESVAREIAATETRLCECVVDTSTIGVRWAKLVHQQLAAQGVDYVDAPVSGGVAGARAASVAVMYAGPETTLGRLEVVFAGMARHVFHVGTEPGQGQAMKVLNNFLSGTAMAATSEALAFGEAAGLDMATMLDVLNASTGRNTATSDKFVHRVLSGSYDAGFTGTQMLKDLTLYREGLTALGANDPVSGEVRAVWAAFDAKEPGGDISRIYPFIRSR